MASTGIKKEKRYKSYFLFGKSSTLRALPDETMMTAYIMIFFTLFLQTEKLDF